MLENLKNFFKKIGKKEDVLLPNSGDAAKERLHLVLMQDRANVSVDFLDLMKQEIIDVIKKYIDIDENEMDVRLTNQINEDGTTTDTIVELGIANDNYVQIKSGLEILLVIRYYILNSFIVSLHYLYFLLFLQILHFPDKTLHGV